MGPGSRFGREGHLLRRVLSVLEVYPGWYRVYMPGRGIPRVVQGCIPPYMPGYSTTMVYLPIYPTIPPWVYPTTLRCYMLYVTGWSGHVEGRPWALTWRIAWVGGAESPS